MSAESLLAVLKHSVALPKPGWHAYGHGSMHAAYMTLPGLINGLDAEHTDCCHVLAFLLHAAMPTRRRQVPT